MNRRLFVSILIGSVFTAAGCLETVQQSSDGQDASRSPHRATSGELVAEIRATRGFMRSSVEEGATANFTSDEIVIRGSYRPPTACYTIFISRLENIENDTVQINISQKKEDEMEGVCEGAYIFYRLIIDGPTLPSSIQITHSNTGETFTLTKNNPGTLSPIPPITTAAE